VLADELDDSLTNISRPGSVWTCRQNMKPQKETEEADCK